MQFDFSPYPTTPQERRLQRIFEILPGALSWTILLGLVVVSWIQPVLAAVLIIAFDLYWLLRVLYMTLFLVLSSIRLSLERHTNWMARVRAVDRLVDGKLPSAPDPAFGPRPWPWAPLAVPARAAGRDVRPTRGVGESTTGLPVGLHRTSSLGLRLSEWLHRRELATLRQSGSPPPPSAQIHHVVILPIAKEPRAVVEPGLQSLARQTFPPQRILVVLAVEARASDQVKQDADALTHAYHSQFLDVLAVTHPDGLPGEARVKGANVTYAARQIAAYLLAHRIPSAQVIVSCFDADTVVNPDYMACLTYGFLVCPSRTRASFQPIPVYHNNIWEAPGFARVLDIGSSFFQLIEATNPDRLVTFSSHSMSFQALQEIGYWPVDMISDDSAIFWKAFIHYDGRYHVVPLRTTVSMDVVAARSWYRTFVSVYRQKRRWAWGVENFPIVMRAFLRANRISLYDRFRHSSKLLGGHVSWATWAFLLTCLGWLPILFVGRRYSTSVLYYSAPRIASTIFHLALIALLTSIILSFCLLPKTRIRYGLLRRVGHALEWLLVPVITIPLGALPALDAQTRLMLGRYMEFWVSEKTRSTHRPSTASVARRNNPERLDPSGPVKYTG